MLAGACGCPEARGKWYLFLLLSSFPRPLTLPFPSLLLPTPRTANTLTMTPTGITRIVNGGL